MDKDKVGGVDGGRWGWLEQGGVVLGKIETTILEQQLKNAKKEEKNKEFITF